MAVAVATACTGQRRARRGAGWRLSCLPRGCSAAARKAGGAPWDRREGIKSLLLPLTIPAVHALVDGRAHPDTHIPTLVRAARAYVCSADVQDSAGSHAAHRSGVTRTPTSIVRSTDLHNQHLWALLIENHVICTNFGMKCRRSHSNT